MMGNKVNYNYYPETTLNHKYGVYAPRLSGGVYVNCPPSGTVPAIGYFGVGIRGFYNITSDDEISPLSQPYAPKATEMDLYRPIPIRCVPVAYDLQGPERAKYRMRTEITMDDGHVYACYWLKTITFENNLNIKTVDGSGNDSNFSFDNAAVDLTPTPVAPTTPTIIAGSTKVVVSANIKCVITGEEILEAINVIYHGDLRRARISEWGIYSGFDQEDAQTPSGETYTEALYVQLAAKRCTTGVDMSNCASEQHEILTIQNGNLLLID